MRNGALDGPACIVETGGGDVLELDNWPPREGLVGTRTFYLGQKGKLLPQFRHDLNVDEPDSFLQRPFYVSEERGRLIYRTAPLTEDVQLAGSHPEVLRLHGPEGHHLAGGPLRGRPPEPLAHYQRLATGLLRKRVPEEDTPWQIKHDYTKFDYPEPGQVYEYELQLRPTAYCFRAGTSIEIEISCVDVPMEETSYDEMWHLCKPRPACTRSTATSSINPPLELPILNKKR